MNKLELKSKIDTLINLIYNLNEEIQTLEDLELKRNSVVIDIPETIAFLTEQLKKLNKSLNTLSEQLLTSVDGIVTRYNEQMNSAYRGYHVDLLKKYTDLLHYLLSLSDEMRRIEYLSLIKENNVVLVGSNGAGKSSFASFLKESMSNNIIVIPAQKFLYYNKMINKLHLTNKTDINIIQKYDFIRRGRFENNKNDYAIQSFMEDLSHLFSKLVAVLSNEQIEAEHQIIHSSHTQSNLLNKRNETILFKLNQHWQNLVPDIVFEVDTLNRTLIPIKNGEMYSLNAMSDGEKAMLYYMCHVFLAESNSFIVVDEPETFLNVSNFNRLWDTLESVRSDCKFIYISHVIDFIVSRSNSDLLWCEYFTHPNNWEIKNIYFQDDAANGLPKELLSELLGSRKPILFCEGTKGSLDYAVYSSLYREQAIVHPVKGHRQVIQYTRAYNNSPLFSGNKAFGIIDSDLMAKSQIDKYLKDGIYTLPFNEIEMLLFTEDVMNDLLIQLYSKEEVEMKIEKFKDKFFECVASQTEVISQEKIKKDLNTKLSNYRISKVQNVDAMVEEVKNWIDDLKMKESVDKFKFELEDTVKRRDYDELLSICPLKNEVAKGLANQYLDNHYIDKALNRIRQNHALGNMVREKYFSKIEFPS